MSVIATAVKHLMAAGIAGDALFAAIAEMEAEIRAEPKPRSSAAIRQERYRRNKASRVTDGDACDAEAEADKNPPQTPHKNPYTPVTPKGVTAPKGAVRSRGSKIDPAWQPPLLADLPPQVRKLADLWSDASYRTEAEAFVNFWLGETGARAAKSDWNRAWANRIVQIHSKVMRDQKFGTAAPDAPAAPQKDRNAMIADAERRLAKFRELGKSDDAERAEKFLRVLRSTGPPSHAAA